MRIAILDDEEAFREAAEERIRSLMQQHFPQEGVAVDAFASAEELLLGTETVVYDLVLLDICMEGMNGMEAAERIRARDSAVGILFVTSSERYLLDGYRVFADGYFLKPIEAQGEGVLLAALTRVFDRVVGRAKTLVVREKQHVHTIPFSKIQYVDLLDGHVHIVTQNQELALPKTMSYRDVQEELLTDARFVECYSKVTVNFDWIEEMENEHFRLQDGKRVPISRRSRTQTRARYMTYLLKGTRR